MVKERSQLLVLLARGDKTSTRGFTLGNRVRVPISRLLEDPTGKPLIPEVTLLGFLEGLITPLLDLFPRLKQPTKGRDPNIGKEADFGLGRNLYKG